MILGAGTYQVDLIKKSKELGHETIVVSPGDYPGMKYADKVLDVNILDHEAVHEAARREQVDGIISDQTDMAVYSIAYACEKLGLPGNGTEVASLFIDKHLMRVRCQQLGLPTIPSEQVSSFDEAMESLGRIGLPAIIKPVDSGGSKGVTRIDTTDDLKAHYEEAAGFSGNGKVIVEKFITGREFEVDSIAVGGDVRTLMYADLNEFKIPNIFASMTRLYPSVADQKTVDRLLAYDRAVLEGFGMVQGLTHSEYIMDDETGEIYLIETALRGGGTYISSHIAELQTHINTSQFLIQMALGELDGVPQFETARCHSGYVAFYLPPGKVASLEGVSAVMDLPFVAKTTMESLREGDVTREFHDKRNRHAVILSGSSREELNERIEQVKSLLKIRIETPEGLRGPIWE